MLIARWNDCMKVSEFSDSIHLFFREYRCIGSTCPTKKNFSFNLKCVVVKLTTLSIKPFLISTQLLVTEFNIYVVVAGVIGSEFNNFIRRHVI